MRCCAGAAVMCLTLAFHSLDAVAQTTASSASQSLLSTRSTLVLVPALVRTRAGKMVFTLKADDFTLTDDGIPQKLTLEQDTGSEPLAPWL
jgi:hypothetical protein